MSEKTICCSMPRACISCEYYTFKGYAHDEHSPFLSLLGQPANNGRVSYGDCDKHGTEVFVTEICPSYQAMPGIEVLEVPNRPRPKEPRQELLL